jgi:hypothetical protein
VLQVCKVLERLQICCRVLGFPVYSCQLKLQKVFAQCNDDTDIDMMLPVVGGLLSQIISDLITAKDVDARSISTQILSLDDILCWEGQHSQPKLDVIKFWQ